MQCGRNGIISKISVNVRDKHWLERLLRDKVEKGQEDGERNVPGWSRSQVSEHDVGSCLRTVTASLYRQCALFYFMYSWASYMHGLIKGRGHSAQRPKLHVIPLSPFASLRVNMAVTTTVKKFCKWTTITRSGRVFTPITTNRLRVLNMFCM